MNNRKEKCRGKWSEKQLQDGMKLLAEGYSQHQASILSGIPRRTLRNHIKTKSTKKEIGRKSILTADQEKDLVARIIRYAETGLPLTPLSVRRVVYQYCEQFNIPHLFNTQKKCAGRSWYRNFMRRNPNLRKRKAQNMNMARAQKLNRFIVNDYFEKLKEVLNRSNLSSEPERIYNMDEKGCRLTIHHSQDVLAQCGAKRVHLIANEHAENVTIVGCVNAIGNPIPPMILFKGKRRKPTFRDNLPAKSVVVMTEKGSMTIEVFNKWLEHFGQFKIPGKVLLILDGAKCHLDLSICMKAEELDIDIFCLPSNTTHELQPLDKSCYGPFEHYWDEELMNYWNRFPDRTLNKERFGAVFTPVWHKSMTSMNIMRGFEATGIYPYAPEKIPDEAFLPSTLTERPENVTLEELADEFDPDDPEEIQMVTQSDGNDSEIRLRNSKETPGPSSITGPPSNETPGRSLIPNPPPQHSNSPETSRSSDDSPPFSSVLPSPHLPPPKKRQTKKAINYKATLLTRKLFDNENTPSVLNDATNVGNSSDNGSKKKKESKSDQIEHLDGERKKIKRTKIEKASTILENVSTQDDADVDEVLATQLLEKGDFVVSKLIYNYGTRKEVEKQFVAQVEKLKAGRRNDQIKLKFLKKNTISNYDGQITYFTFPTIPDIFLVSKDQILHKVNLKNVNRGRYYFEHFDSSNIE